jgi:hypothetical protein
MLRRIMTVHTMLMVRIALYVKYMPLNDAFVSRFTFP